MEDTTPVYGDVTAADDAPSLDADEVLMIVRMGVEAVPFAGSLTLRGGSDVVQALAVRRQAGDGGEVAEHGGTRWTQFGRVVLVERSGESPEVVVYRAARDAVAAVRAARTEEGSER